MLLPLLFRSVKRCLSNRARLAYGDDEGVERDSTVDAFILVLCIDFPLDRLDILCKLHLFIFRPGTEHHPMWLKEDDMLLAAIDYPHDEVRVEPRVFVKTYTIFRNIAEQVDLFSVEEICVLIDVSLNPLHQFFFTLIEPFRGDCSDFTRRPTGLCAERLVQVVLEEDIGDKSCVPICIDPVDLPDERINCLDYVCFVFTNFHDVLLELEVPM